MCHWVQCRDGQPGSLICLPKLRWPLLYRMFHMSDQPVLVPRPGVSRLHLPSVLPTQHSAHVQIYPENIQVAVWDLCHVTEFSIEGAVDENTNKNVLIFNYRNRQREVMHLYKKENTQDINKLPFTHLAMGQPCPLLPSLPVYTTFSILMALPVSPDLSQEI